MQIQQQALSSTVLMLSVFIQVHGLEIAASPHTFISAGCCCPDGVTAGWAWGLETFILYGRQSWVNMFV